MKSDAGFLDQIEAAPEDESVRLVYADWLEERHDPRAEYLRSELALARMQDTEVRRRLRAARAKIDPAWLAVLEQPAIMRANPTPFPSTWWGIDLREHRPADGTYGSWPYQSLPSVSHADVADFAATRRAPPPTMSTKPDWTPIQDEITRVEQRATELGVVVPPSLRTFFTGDLPYRLRSCTACWFNLGEPVLNPDDDGAVFLRFYSDQQSCLHWYIYLDRSGSHCVVSGVEPFDDDEPEWIDEDYEEEEDDGSEIDPVEAEAQAQKLLDAIEGRWPETPSPPKESRPIVVKEPCFAAPSFESFIHRWWIENEIWYALVGKSTLTDEHRAYLAHYTAAGG